MLGIIIQARVGSKRLPNKMLLPFYLNKGVLELLLEKLKNQLAHLPIVVATSDKNEDNKIVEICNKHNINFFCGSEENVLERFIDAANKYNLTKIIRICADNPFLNIDEINNLIHNFQKSELDYLSFQTSNGIPVMRTHFGFWAEVVTLNALKKIRKSTESSFYFEHVTNYIYKNLTRFNAKFILIDPFVEHQQSIRMTLDTIEDFNLLKEIYNEYLKLSDKTIKSLIKLVSSNEIWLEKMNSQILKNIK